MPESQHTSQPPLKVKPLPSSVLKWILYPLLGLIVIAGIAAGILGLQASSFRNSDLIARNVTIAAVPVGQMRKTDALAKLREQWLPTLPQEVKLTSGSKTFTVKADQLGREPQLDAAVDEAMQLGREPALLAQLATHLRLMKSSIDLPVAVTVDKHRAAEQVARIAAQLDRAPVDARVSVTGSDSVDVVAGKPGLKVDQRASVAAIEKALATVTQDTVALIVREKQPKITAKELANLEVVLGSYTTSYSAGKVDRSHNLQLAISSVNGTVVMPGEIFSTDQAIGPRDEEHGFRDAPIFVDGDITPATGGGICQIATTIYNAALFAGLDVTERHHHSQPVHYAPPGRDATVYAGQLDLTFRNNTSYPIVVLGTMGSGSVTVNIVGKREANRKIRLESSGVTSVPYDTQTVPDPTLPLGKKQVDTKGRNGVSVSVYRIMIKPDGTQARELLHNDTYKPQKAIIRVGTMKPPVPLGPDGKPLPLKLGPDGKPVVGKDGKYVVLKPATPAKPGAKPAAAAAKPVKNVCKPAKPAKPTKKPVKKPTKKPAAHKPQPHE